MTIETEEQTLEQDQSGEVEAVKGTTTATDPLTDDKAAPPKANGKATLAEGGDEDGEGTSKTAAETAADKKATDDRFTWPATWREEAARHYAAGDAKIYEKELKRLSRITDPAAMWGSFRELEGRFTSGGLVKLPGKDAKPEEVKAYHKAVGVPEKADEYLADLTLDNGAVVGEADKPILGRFAEKFLEAGVSKAQAQKIINEYYQQEIDLTEARDEGDETHRRDSETGLRDEYGDAYKRKLSAVSSLFATAPGGADKNNPHALFSRIMGGRTADGKLIGNDLESVKFLVALADVLKPEASVIDGTIPNQTIDSEISTIEDKMRTDRRTYNADLKMQARYLELLGARDRMKQRY